MEQKGDITFEDFLKVDLRVGTIVSCENIAKSEKLLKLEVDFGELGNRQVLAGIAQWYKPEDLVGVQTAFVFNMPPRKMMELESQGMLLAGNDGEVDSPVLMRFDREVVNGSALR